MNSKILIALIMVNSYACNGMTSDSNMSWALPSSSSFPSDQVITSQCELCNTVLSVELNSLYTAQYQHMVTYHPELLDQYKTPALPLYTHTTYTPPSSVGQLEDYDTRHNPNTHDNNSNKNIASTYSQLDNQPEYIYPLDIPCIFCKKYMNPSPENLIKTFKSHLYRYHRDHLPTLDEMREFLNKNLPNFIITNQHAVQCIYCTKTYTSTSSAYDLMTTVRQHLKHQHKITNKDNIRNMIHKLKKHITTTAVRIPKQQFLQHKLKTKELR